MTPTVKTERCGLPYNTMRAPSPFYLMLKIDWLEKLRALHKAKNGYHFDIGDHVNMGVSTWGSEECWSALAQITGSKSTRNFYRRCATVAAQYPPSLRFANLTFSVYERLRHFPLPFLEKFVPSVADCGRSCAQILALAIEQFGSNPSPRKERLKRCSVNLSSAVYTVALAAAKKVKLQPQYWIENVIKDHLKQHADVPNPPASAGPSVPNESEATTPRPTRPAAKIVAGAKPRKRRKELKLQWVACSQGSPDAGVGGRALKSTRAQCFATEAAARAAEEAYFAEKGYHNEVIYCVKPCGAYHVRHAYSCESQRKSASTSA